MHFQANVSDRVSYTYTYEYVMRWICDLYTTTSKEMPMHHGTNIIIYIIHVSTRSCNNEFILFLLREKRADFEH